MKLLKLLAAAALPLSLAAGPAFAQSASGVVISQFAVRGPVGGNDEFVEIYNSSTTPIAIGGWTLQGCASGTPGAPSVRATVPAGTSLLPGRYFLFANTVAPTTTSYSLGVAPDATYTTGITDFAANNFAGIRIVSSNSTAVGAGTAIDGVGSNQSPCREGTGIVTPTANGVNTAYLRAIVGGFVQDSNNNAVDFPSAGQGTPRNSASPANGGGGAALPTVSLSVSPTSFTEANGTAVVTATLSAAYTANVTVNFAFTGTATNGTDYSPSATSITIPTGATTGTITLTAIEDATYEGDETVITSIGTLTNATAGSPSSATATILDNDPVPPPVIGPRIYQVQGNRHISPMAGQSVSNVPGIVTVVDSNGFYMQDGDGDGDVNTSDGILVFTSTAPTVTVGQQVLVSGTVSEFRPNGATGLSVTEITAPVISPSANLFINNTIVPTVIGIGGRVPPTDIIDNDSNGNVETSPTSVFDPSEDGIDFYETLEGMLVQINNPVLTSPTLAGTAAGDRQYFVLGDNGSAATGRSARGGVTLVERASGVDYNPERIELFTGLPNTNAPVGTIFNVGDSLVGPIRGVMSYFGNYEVLPTAAPVVATPANNAPTVTSNVQKGGDRLSVATFNIENYDPNDPIARRNKLAFEIVNNLQSPDIISLGEVQDNNGAAAGGVAADVTIQTLIDAIVAAGGPTYSYQQINPATGNPDGGEPGGNIRVVQLYNPLRVTFVPGTVGVGGSLDATAVQLVNGKLVLTLSPGRLSPTNSAWSSSRKPLAVTYDFNGRRILVIGNHFNSKGGDQSLYGVNQPPVLSSETQRRQQTLIVHDFVYGALALDPNARIVVLGDLNDFDFSAPLRILRNGPLGPNGEEGTQPALINLGTALVPNPAERYSYVFDGNSQELDHILATPYLFNTSNPQYQVAHTNSEYGDQASDHDPIVSSYLIPTNVAPTAVAVATPTVATSGDPVSLDGTASTDSDGTIASYAWSQTFGPAVSIINGNSATASFVAPSVTSSQTLSFTLTVTDNDGATGTATVSVTVNPANRPPVAVDDTLTLDQDTSATVDVLANDSDPDSDPLTISTVGTPTNGTAALEGTLIRYTPNAGYSGSDSFTYTISDGRGGSASATVSVTVNDTVPNTFSFQSVTNAERNTLKTSNTITVTGITTATSISISTGGTYSVNGGTYTAAGGTVSSGDTVSVQLTSSASFASTKTVTLTIGGVSAGYSVTTRNANTLPTPFSFAPVSNAPLNTPVISGSIVVTGIEAPASISIVGGDYSINNGPFQNFVGAVVNNGDTVRVRVTSSSQFSTTTSATLTIDAFSAVFSVTTLAADTTPDSFSFGSFSNVALGSVQTSNTITVSGINTATPISVSSGGSYSVNGGAFVSAAGTVNSGDTVAVRQTASASFSTTTTVTLNIGGVAAGFSVTTLAADTTPDSFSFGSIINVSPATLQTSNAITVSGINTGAPISVSTGGSYSINGGAFTSAPGTVNSGDSVRVQQVSSSSFSTSTTVTLNIGGVAAGFTVTTVAIDTTPDSFSFTPKTGVLRNSAQTSNAITVAGINAPTPISVSGGSYSVNGGPFRTTSGTVASGDTVVVQQTSSRRFNTTTTATLNIGGVTGSFSVTTRKVIQRANGTNAEPDDELAPGLLDRLPLLR